MKGIVVLSYHKKPGAFVDSEFPFRISESLDFSSNDFNKLYNFNRMKDSGPNYIYMNINNHQIASYFTGSDPLICTGSPNHCIYLILDQEDPTKWEAELKQIALELLPRYYSLVDDLSSGEEPPSNLDNQEILDQMERKFLDLQKMEYSDHLIDEMISKMDDDSSTDVIDGKMAVMELEVWRERIETISHEKLKLLKENEQLKQKISELEKHDYSSSESVSEKSIENVQRLSTSLEEANLKASSQLEKLAEQAISFEQTKLNYEKLQIKHKKYEESALATIEAKNEEIRLLHKKTRDQTLHPVLHASGTQPLDNEIQALKDELQIQKKEVIEAKKTIKVQEKDVYNLRKMLDLT